MDLAVVEELDSHEIFHVTVVGEDLVAVAGR